MDGIQFTNFHEYLVVVPKNQALQMVQKIFILIIAISFSLDKAEAQDTTAFTFSGYCELYYSFDFDNPENHRKPFFLYNHARHNEVNVNLAYVKVNYAHAKVRSNFAIMTGTYAQLNLAAEPELLRMVYEANIGLKLSKQHNIWLDAGIMPSHVGFESAVGTDCWTASRSMVAENSPYYETGIKVTSTNKKENFFFSALVLNGWQRIQRPMGVNSPSFGLQFNFKPNKNLTLNYSNFIGTDKPDTVHAWRTYHNFYAIYQANKKWGIIGGFDIGRDKNLKNQYSLWYSPVVMIRRSVNSNSFVAFRGEYFSDVQQTLLQTSTTNGFQIFGLSLNYDYSVTKNALVRVEGKGYFSKDRIFKNNMENNNYTVLCAISLRL